MSTKILISSLESHIHTVLDDKKNMKAINNLIDSYIDKNTEVLYASSPSYRLFFSEERERKPIYDMFSITPKMIEDLLDKIPTVNKSWEVQNNTFYNLMTMIIRDLVKRNEKYTFQNCLMFLSMYMYSTLQYKYFRFLPNEDIMNYTINNINNKFLLKSLGSIYKTLEHTMLVNHDKYKTGLLKGNDDDILGYFVNLRIRLNNLLNHIKDKYETNRKNKNYLSHDSENNDSENYRENDNISTDISRIVNNTSLKFFTNSIDSKLVRISAEATNTDKMSLQISLDNIRDNETKVVKELISLILQIYLGENSIDSIRSKKFVTSTILIYSKSNTNDKRVIRIKEILEELLVSYSDKYSHMKGVTAKINYKKAVFIYMTLFIQSVN